MFIHRRLTALMLAGFAIAGLGQSAAASEPAPFQFAAPTVAATPKTIELGGDLRKMAANQSDLFFGGEFASRTLSFFALPTEASDASRLVLTLQTAISVAPEQSRMVVRVNGTDIGSSGLMAGNPRRVQFDVPAGLVHPGYNAVTIEADHRHRVDCSINATYELWTKIDPEKSGFVYGSSAKPALSLVDLLPLSGTRNGRTAMRVVMPQSTRMEDYDRATKVVQALTILGNFNHPNVEFATTPGTGPGIDIYLGTKPDLAATLGSDHKAVVADEHMVVDAEGAQGRKRLVISGMTLPELDARVQELVTTATNDRPAGTPEGLTALANLKGRMLMPGQRVSLADLGYTPKRFSGRYSLSQLNFTMPSDFYPGDYSSISFHLNALYVGGLAPDAVLAVKANDKVVANIPLSSTRDGEIRDQRLPIPFSVLRPGQNTLKIEARLPSKLDAACESVDRASASVRLAINANSYLEVPDYARIGRYPDIAVLTSGLTPKSVGQADARTYLFVPSYDKQGVNAAATFIAKMAYSSGRIKETEFTSTLPELDHSNLIAFGSYDTLPSDLVSRMHLDFSNIAIASTKASPLEVASLDNSALVLPANAADTQEPGRTRLASLQQQAQSFLLSPSDYSASMLENATGFASREMKKLHMKYLPALLGDDRVDTYSPSADAAMVVAQQSSPNGGVWTIVAARKSEMLAGQADVLTDYSVWNKLGGAIQSFSETGAIIDQRFSANENLFQTQPVTLANARLIAAGWLANNAEIYISALICAAVFLGLGTFLVLITGRRDNV